MTSSRLAEACLRVGVVYMLIGMGLGVTMGASEDFTLKDVHAHVNLLGYVTTFIFGLFLKVYPQAAELKITRIGVYTSFAVVPIMLALLAAFSLGHIGVAPAMGLLSILTVLAYVLLALTVFRATAKTA